MSVVMSMHWPEITVEQYENVRREVNWEGRVPAGAQFHVAWFGPDGFRVLDLWESGGHFQKFSEARLMPVVMKLGVSTAPQVTLTPAHAVFAPKVPTAPGTARARKPSQPAARRAKKATRPARRAARKTRRR